MPYRKFEFAANQYYHLYNRGNNHAIIFRDAENYRYFLRQLGKYLVPDQVEIVAYCLMPDHYHLLVCPRVDTLSKLMQPFLLAYTHAFNKRYGRMGALFQGRFKARYVGKNEYLLHLSRYILLNPVRAGLVKQAEDWEFSSYRDYLGLRTGSKLNPKIVMDQFHFPPEFIIHPFF
jgi:REP element-mobilizing transposase RayT